MHMPRITVIESPERGAEDQEYKTQAAPLDFSDSFDWKPYLKNAVNGKSGSTHSSSSSMPFSASSVSCFKHAPMHNAWENISVGMKLEVCHREGATSPGTNAQQSYWVATVIQLAGYEALLRYEGFGQDSSRDFWLHLCMPDVVHPVGWCATQGKPLIPPKGLVSKNIEWKEFLVKRLTGARTLPLEFNRQVRDCVKSEWKPGMRIEVVDRERIAQVRVASISNVLGGRLHLRYQGLKEDDPGMWCHEKATILHPVGWAHSVRHDICATSRYLSRVEEEKRDERDAPRHLIPKPLWSPPQGEKGPILFQEGQMLEAIDPLNLSTIGVASISKILNDGYMMVRMEYYDDDEELDSFCHHMSSKTIFPAGFCDLHDIPLIPPKWWEKPTFSWSECLSSSDAKAAPPQLFKRDTPDHGFEEGMKLEAVDSMDPKLICVATVARVVGRLLKIHFDGWEENFDQWVDCESPDIYPIGYCLLVKYPLQAPRGYEKGTMTKAGRRKGGSRGRRKRRGRRKTVEIEKEKVDEKGGREEEEEGTSEGEDMEDPLATSLPDPPHLNPPPEMIQDGEETKADVKKDVVLDMSDPSSWSVAEVAEYLQINDCPLYAQRFQDEGVDGKKFLYLSRDEVLELAGMKLGPSLKILNLIKQLRVRMNPALSRQIFLHK